LVLRDEALLRESAMYHFAHQTPLTIERIHKHAVADLPRIDSRTCFENLARHVETNDHRQWHLDAWHATYCEQVVVIEGCGLHPNHDVPLHHDGVGEVRHILKLFEAALLFKDYSFHDITMQCEAV
jgi:hypothetical protein